MQNRRGFLFARVDGKLRDFIVSSQDDVWRKRRSILTPAFSAHKMKLVGEGMQCYSAMYAAQCCSKRKHSAPDTCSVTPCNVTQHTHMMLKHIELVYLFMQDIQRVLLHPHSSCTCNAPKCTFMLNCTDGTSY